MIRDSQPYNDQFGFMDVECLAFLILHHPEDFIQEVLYYPFNLGIIEDF